MLLLKKLVHSFLIGVLMASVSKPALAQEIFSKGFELGAGSRAIAMGGAYTSISDDYLASWWNPAGLAQIGRFEVFGSLDRLTRESKIDLLTNASGFSDINAEDEQNYTNVNSIGLAFPYSTAKGRLVMSIGLNRIKSFDSNFHFKSVDEKKDDFVNLDWSAIGRESLDALIIASALDISPNASIGLALNFWKDGSDLESGFRKLFRDDNSDVVRKAGSQDIDISGMNFKLGALFRMGRVLQIGATVATPITFKVKESLTVSAETFPDSLSTVSFEHKIRSPWTITTGASIHLINFVFSGDLEFSDWSQIRYKTDPPFERGSMAEANQLIAENYGPHYKIEIGQIDFTIPKPRVRLGAEFTIPQTGLSFRGGYFNDPAIVKDAHSDEDKEFYSGGLGFQFDNHVKLDLTFVHGSWSNFDSAQPESGEFVDYVQEIKANKLIVSLAIRY